MRLVRTENLPTATRGVLQDDEGIQLCYTLEEPWRDENHDGLGDKGVSRIPAGKYRVHKRWSESRHRDMFEVLKVPGRAAILIHAGNTVADTEGCILLGQQEGELDGEPAVLKSKAAFDSFMAQQTDDFDLEVIDA